MSDIDIDSLKERSLIPKDSEVVSDHNNIVVISPSEKIVARIALQSSINMRTTPGDIGYAHRLSWELRDLNVAVTPLMPEPTIDGDVVVSMYPLLDPFSWERVRPEDVQAVISTFGASKDTFSEDTKRQLYMLDVPAYAHNRLNHLHETENDASSDKLVDAVETQLELYDSKFPFAALRKSDEGLVHGDLHTANIVTKHSDPLLIDLDSTSLGPRLYDLASWNVRALRGERAPIDKMINLQKRTEGWDQETFDILMGWKVISSMTHILRYENARRREASLHELTETAVRVGIPGISSL